MISVIVAGVILGLASNLHCLGMCGPIAMVIPLNRKSNLTILLGALQYNFGRLLAYSILGVIIGLIGMLINVFNLLQVLSIIAGVLIILFALRKQISSLFPKNLGLIKIQKLLQKGLNFAVHSKSKMKLIMLGLVNGFLPCGMVYFALISASLAGSIIGGISGMLAFGVGTLPMMMVIPFVMNKISFRFKAKMNFIIPYMMVIVGTLIIVRGLNLGIPYISPKIETKQSEQGTPLDYKPSEVKMNCH